MNTTDNPLVADCSVENSNTTLAEIEKQIADENSLKNTITTFRNSIIEMVTEVNYKQEFVVNAFDATVEKHERPTNYNHYISYKGSLYQRDNFLYAFFPDYKKYKKRVKFLNDTVMFLSSIQRNKLQYHILSQKFSLLALDKESDVKDKDDLLLFLDKYKNEHEQAQQWYNRMAWQDGHQKIITFGVSLEVQGTNKGVWCYASNIDSEQATFNGVLMYWETWLKPIADKLDIIREQMKHKCITDKKQKPRYYSAAYESIKPMLYYQNERHLTLPAAEIDAIRKWVYKYLDNGNTTLPYNGIMPNADLKFTIDFEKDIEIVDTHDLKSSAGMAGYNKLNNDKRNKDKGKRQSWETFGRLVGNEWTTAEIRNQGFTDKQIRTWRGYGWITIKEKKGNKYIYSRVLV